MNTVATFAKKHNPANRWADLQVGWTVRIHQKLREGEKAKASTFEGIIVSKKHGNEAGGTIRVRRSAGAFGVEKTYPLLLPSIEKIEVIKRAKVRRAKLYYLRDKSARETRRKTRTEYVQEKLAEMERKRAEAVARAAEAAAKAAETPPAEEPATDEQAAK
jgi:large subunit ribosomal protein L19